MPQHPFFWRCFSKFATSDKTKIDVKESKIERFKMVEQLL
jgi:hypothetical protein